MEKMKAKSRLIEGVRIKSEKLKTKSQKSIWKHAFEPDLWWPLRVTPLRAHVSYEMGGRVGVGSTS